MSFSEIAHTCGAWPCCAPPCPAWNTLTSDEQAYHNDIASKAKRHGTEELLSQIRGAGWSVAVHNDYQLNNERFTFWLFTHENGRYVKGEGRSDVEALNIVLEAIG